MKLYLSALFSLLLIAPVVAILQSQRPSGKPGGDRSPSGRPVTGTAPSNQLVRSDAIKELITYAHNPPPELAADLLMRIVESGLITDEKYKREIIEESFQIARDARLSVKRVQALGTAVDTRSGYLANASALNLDGQSLQCRAVNAMLAVDKGKARELFEQINPPKLEPLSCEDDLLYDLSAFYETVLKVAQMTFSPKEIRRGEKARFIERYTSDLSSPAQVGPSARLIASADVNSAQFATLVQSFSTAISKISGDYRSFSSSLTGDPTTYAIADLVRKCESLKVPTLELLRSFRSYLVTNFSSNRCADSRGSDVANETIGFFNKSLLSLTPSGKAVLPITVDDTKPTKIEGRPDVHAYWQSTKSRKLLSGFRRLRFGSGRMELSPDERKSDGWQKLLNDYLIDLANWKPEDESDEIDYFHEKSVLLGGLVELAPDEQRAGEFTRLFIDFLESYPARSATPMEWFLHANQLLERARSLQGDERRKLLDMLENSRHPALFLYGRLEDLSTSRSLKGVNSQ